MDGVKALTEMYGWAVEKEELCNDPTKRIVYQETRERLEELRPELKYYGALVQRLLGRG